EREHKPGQVFEPHQHQGQRSPGPTRVAKWDGQDASAKGAHRNRVHRSARKPRHEFMARQGSWRAADQPRAAAMASNIGLVTGYSLMNGAQTLPSISLRTCSRSDFAIGVNVTP